MKPNKTNMETTDCGINDDAEQQPDCSDCASDMTSERFSEDRNKEESVKRIQNLNKAEAKDKDRIKSDIREIRGLLPPMYTTEKKLTNHELLQNTIVFIRALVAQNKELTTCIENLKDAGNERLIKENEELRMKNKQYLNILETTGLPDGVDPSLLEVTWKLRDNTVTSETCVSDSGLVPSGDQVTNGNLEASEFSLSDAQMDEYHNIPDENGFAKDVVPEESIPEVSDLHSGSSESADITPDLNVETVMQTCNPVQADATQETPYSSSVVSSTESQPVFMSPDSRSDQQVDVEKTVTHLPISQSNGNLSDISEPTSDAEGNDTPLLTVGRLALENAFRQSSLNLESHKTSSEAAFKVDDPGQPQIHVHSSVVSMTEESQRYLQMMQPYSTHLSTSVDPLLGLSNATPSRFVTASTCPVSPNVAESSSSLTTCGQMNNVMMLPSGQLVLVSPPQSTNSNALHASEQGIASVLPNGNTSTLAVHPQRQDNSVSLQQQTQPGLFATNFNIPGVNPGLTLGSQAASNMHAVSANNTVFMNPPVQYGVPPQPMTFISGGQPGNVLPLIQQSCPPVNHLAMTQNPAMTVNVPQGPVTLNALQQPAPQNQHPSALILPNGQIVPVVTQPNLLFPQQQCTPVTGGLLVPSVQAPNLNIISNVQNPTQQFRFGSNLVPTSAIQPTQVIANIRTPAYSILQNPGQNHHHHQQQQQQYQIVGNSLQPIGGINGASGILLSQPRQKDGFALKNVTSSLSGLALPQNPGQFTVLSGNCLGALNSQHLSNSGMFGGSCSTTVSTAVPLLQSKPNMFGSTTALPNIPATLTAMLTPEGSIILAIPGCRDGELANPVTGQGSSSKAQKVTQRPLMPKPTSKLDPVGQLTSAAAGSKTCPNVISCDFGSPLGGTISVTSSPMLPLTVNTTTNMDFSCILSGPGSTTSSTDILAKATKSIFSISPYENLSPRSMFNSGINDHLLTLSNAAASVKNDAPLNDVKSSTSSKLKRSKPKPKPAKSGKKKNPKSILTAASLMPDICHNIIETRETVVTAELSPRDSVIEQLANDDEVSDINDFSDLIRMEPMSPVAQKVVTESKIQPAPESENKESAEMLNLPVNAELNAGSECSIVEGMDDAVHELGPVASTEKEKELDSLMESVPCSVSSTAASENSYSAIIKTGSDPTPDVSSAIRELPDVSCAIMELSDVSSAIKELPDVSSAIKELPDVSSAITEVHNVFSAINVSSAIKQLPLSNDVETTSCREVGTSTERKRKKHKKQKSRAEQEVHQEDVGAKGKRFQNGTPDKHKTSGLKAAQNHLLSREEGPTEHTAFGKSEKSQAISSNRLAEIVSSDSAGDNLLFASLKNTEDSKLEDNCISIRDDKFEGASQKGKTSLQGLENSKYGLGKKARKRLHKLSCFHKADMLPDTLTFTESELLDVVDKVENMVMSDDRVARKRSHDRTKTRESTGTEKVAAKKLKCDKTTEVDLDNNSETLTNTVNQLSWPAVTPSVDTSTNSNKDLMPQMPDCLPGFELEEDMVGFSMPAGFSSHSLTPEYMDKECQAANSPIFSLELVVPDSMERSPDHALPECSENKQPESSPSGVREANGIEAPSCELSLSSSSSFVSSSSSSHNNPNSTTVDATERNEQANMLPIPSTTCTSSQARHSGIVSLAKQVASSKPHGSASAGVQPKAIASKNSSTRTSQGNFQAETDSLFTTVATPQSTSLDTYSENIFSGKDNYMPSSKDLGLDFSFELDSKDKSSPCDVTSAYDWVMGADTEPQTLPNFSISSPTCSEQSKSDCQLEMKSVQQKTITTEVSNAILPPESAAVQPTSVCSAAPTQQTTATCTALSSSPAAYVSPSKTPVVENRSTPAPVPVPVKQSMPSSAGLQEMSTTFSSVFSTEATSCHRSRNSVATIGSTISTFTTVTTANHQEVIPSSNVHARSLSCSHHSPLSATPNSTFTPTFNQKTTSMPASLSCATTKSTIASCSVSSQHSYSQKSLESQVRSAALPHETSHSASMYRLSMPSERPERLSCSKEGAARTNADYFGAASQMSTSSSCAVQGKSLDDPFHYPFPPYLFNGSREYGNQGGSRLPRYSSAGNYGMLSNSSCASDYNALARYSVYFSSSFPHDLGLDMNMARQRMSPNQSLPSCSIEKNLQSSAKVASASANRLNSAGAKSCQARPQDDAYANFSGSSLGMPHNNQDTSGHRGSNHFLDPTNAASHIGLHAHNRDSSNSGRSSQRPNTAMQNTSSNRSRSSTRSPASGSERSSSFALHNTYTETSVVSSLTSPPLHHHSVAASRNCLGQQLGYDLSFHAPALQNFSPNLNGVGFDPPPLNFSRDCANTTSPQTQSKKTGKKVEEHTAGAGSKMVLNHHSKHQPPSSHQSQQPSKSGSGSSRSSKSSKKTGKSSNYEVDSNAYENRSVTPYLGLGNLSPSVNFPSDSLAYVNFFSNTNRPLTSAAKALHHRDPPAPISHPFNSSLFSPTRTQNGLGLNFQTGFGMEHMNAPHITSSQMIIPHSSAISAHMHGFGFFPDISGSMVQREALNNMPPMKFGHGTILPSQGAVEPSPLHHPQTVGTSSYSNRGQLPSHMLHDMGFNALLGHQHAAFDTRSISGGMVHPPFGSHGHGASFGMGPLNFPVHNL